MLNPLSGAGPSCDVVVIGAGPAGSTAATLLCEQGWRVVLLEKESHPRFHIGESLLPMNIPIFERLGVLDQISRIGVLKYGAEFGASHYQHKRTAYFRKARPGIDDFAFQVPRAAFDKCLFDNAIAKGVEAHQEMTVTEVDLHAGHSKVAATDRRQQRHCWQTRFVIDASGRDTVLARKLALKQKNRNHQSAALFGHFKNVERLADADAGNISVYWFQHGWFWLIPLPEGVMSVGAVCWPEYLKTRGSKKAQQFLWETIALCPEAARRMSNAELCGQVYAAGNYSYRARTMHGDGFILIGDAYAFVDPVFSTGVLLAMQSAVFGAEAVHDWLSDPASAKPRLRQFERRIRRGIGLVSWFIYRFSSPAMLHLFMNPRNVLGIEQAIVSMLAGDLFGPRRRYLPLAMFKAIYLIAVLANLPRSWAFYWRRKRNANLKFSASGDHS